MGWLDTIKQGYSNIGNNLDYIGTKYHLPEIGLSEYFAMGPTMNTDNPGVTVEDMNKRTQTTLDEAAKLAAARNSAGSDTTSNPTGRTINQTPTNDDPNGLRGYNDENRNIELENARNSLSTLLRNIENQKGFAGQAKDNILNHLKSMYYGEDGIDNNSGGLLGSNYEKKLAEMELLGKQEQGQKTMYEGDDELGKKGLFDINLDNKYSQLQGLDKRASDVVRDTDTSLATNAKKKFEADTLNRVLARARGMSGSSDYDMAKRKTNDDSERMGRELLSDRKDKLFNVGQEQTQQRGWYDEKDLGLRNEFGNKMGAIAGEKTSTEKFHNDLDYNLRKEYGTYVSNEENDYNSKMSNLLSQEQLYGIDNTQRVREIELEHRRKLSEIDEYISKKSDSNYLKGYNDSGSATSNTIANRSSLKNIEKDLAVNKESGNLSNALSQGIENKLGNRSVIDMVNNVDLNAFKNYAPLTPDEGQKYNIRKPLTLEEEDPYGYLKRLFNA